MHTKLTALIAASLFVLAACGSDGSDGAGEAGSKDGDAPAAAPEDFSTPYAGAKAYPIFVSSEIVVGENRFLIGLLNENDAPFASPNIEVTIDFYDFEGSLDEPVFSEETEFVWIVEDQGRGLYVAHPEFDHPGKWGAAVSIEGEGYDENLKGSFEVAEEPTTPAIGEDVPASDTPTLDTVKSIEQISTDDDPVDRFYETSVAEALKKGEPFVFVLATPKFCTSAVCGPTLDDVEKVAVDFPNITFIHSEIYEDNDPAKPVVPAVQEWGLPSEPWVFVVGADGKLVAKFEGSAPPQELRPVLEKL